MRSVHQHHGVQRINDPRVLRTFSAALLAFHARIATGTTLGAQRGHISPLNRLASPALAVAAVCLLHRSPIALRDHPVRSHSRRMKGRHWNARFLKRPGAGVVGPPHDRAHESPGHRSRARNTLENGRAILLRGDREAAP